MRAAAHKLQKLTNGSHRHAVLRVMDLHAGGEPARVVLDGMPEVAGASMLAKRKTLMEDMDHIRQFLLQEPRGYPCQNANVLFPSSNPAAKWGYVIMEQGRVYPAMSGHNTICVATALLETGRVEMTEGKSKFTLEAPGGLIDIEAECREQSVQSITFRNMPSFVEHRDVVVHVPTLQNPDVRVDIVFGGMWYVVVHARDVGLSVHPSNGNALCSVGERIKAAAREQFPVNHPLIDYPGCDILVFRDDPTPGSGAHAKNAVVMSNGVLDWENPATWTGMIDRSPCGTGTCAVMASLHARGELGLHEDFVHESIVGSRFVGRLVGEEKVGDKQGVLPTISGTAHATMLGELLLHPEDPFPSGFTVGDIWSA